MSRPTLALVTLALGLAFAARPVHAQELNCTVSINRQQLTGNEYEFLDELRSQVERYFNDRAWTDDVYDNRERIDCTVQITITQAVSLTQFNAQIAVQATRPIYGTAQRSLTLRLLDNTWAFNYARGQALVFDLNRFDSLSSVLDFYALVVLGTDYDTFSELGGQTYWERARQVADLGRVVTSDLGNGWTALNSTDDRSRSDLVQQMLDPVFLPLRRAQFAYHFGALDRFTADPETSWTAALATLEALHGLYLTFNRRRYATDVFYSAKFTELASLFRDAPQRNEAYAYLSEMDATHLSTDDVLVNGQ